MKQLFVECRYTKKIRLDNSIIKALPEKICLCSSIQYLDSLAGIKKQLESHSKKVVLFSGKKTKYPGQLLGCETSRFDAAAFLYIGDGIFHPQTLLFNNAKPVFALNPAAKKLSKFTEKDIVRIKKQEKAALAKFYSSENIGVLISAKPGQNRMKDALNFKKKWEKEKKIYLFLVDTLDFGELENFNYIDCWVNTMCPRLALNDLVRAKKAIINIDRI